jgi:hypothetical protein
LIKPTSLTKQKTTKPKKGIFMDFMSPVSLIFAMAIPILSIVLAIIFVVSHKRIAHAHEEMASAHQEIAKQLASISIELRHKNSD